MDTEFMDDNLQNQIKNRVQEEDVENVGLHSNQRRSSGNMDTEFMMDVGPKSNQEEFLETRHKVHE